MTLPGINTMPPLGASKQIFEIDRVDYLAPTGKGRMGGVTAGWPLWKSTITIGTLTRRQSDVWRAFYRAQRGAQRIWYGYEIARLMPVAYVNGLPGGWNGDCASWGQTIDPNSYAVLTLTGFPPGFTLSLGDYIGFRWGSFQRLKVACVEDATADGSGMIQVSVEPPVHPVVPASAVAHVANPMCLMKFSSQESEIGGIGRRGAIESGTLIGIQDIMP